MTDQHGDPAALAPAKPVRQEQRRATSEITEVAPGVLRSQLPIDIPGLGHVNSYFLEDERGVAVVDPGLPNKVSYAALTERLAAAGYPLDRVHTVIVTHSHPDHFGGAAWLRAQSGADIVSHRSFRMIWDPAEPSDELDVEDLPDLVETHGRRAGHLPWEPPPWGGPALELSLKRRMSVRVARRFPRLRWMPVPTVRLDDAQTIRLARRDWIAVHTPGHTEDHLCLFDPVEGSMLCGDHVLPTITPHIGGLGQSHDPLARFFGSLTKIAGFGADVKIALPAHGDPFSDLAGRASEIGEHHRGRLEKLRTTSVELQRPATVMEMSTHLFSPRAQGTMADSETFAHLEHLRLRGEMSRSESDGVFRYILAD